jgi:hypothetical protein
VKGLNRFQRRRNHQTFKNTTLTTEEAKIILAHQGFKEFRISDEIVYLETMSQEDLKLVMKEIYGVQIVEKTVLVDQFGKQVDTKSLKMIKGGADGTGPDKT